MRIALVLLVAAVGQAPLMAQVASGPSWDARRLLVSRQDLQELVQNLEQVSTSTSYNAETRERATAELNMLTTRLETGDLHTGDQIELAVEGEPELTNTFVVRDGRRITVPVVGDIPLDGILRSELEDHIRDHLARYIREPVVRARSLTRIAVLGAVSQPGFYVVGSDMVLADVIMQAGGPLGSARLDRTTVQRGGTDLLAHAAVQSALTEGQTLDRMSLRAGDQIIIPERSSSVGTFTLAQMLLTGVPSVIVTMLSLFDVL